MQTHLGRVILWMSGTLISFSVMALCIRELARTLTVFEMFTIRNGSGLLILAGVALASPSLRLGLRSKRMPLHWLRNLVHFTAQTLWAKALIVLPLGMAFALEFTAPAWVALLAVVFLHERMTVSRVLAVVLGIIGVLVIVRPGLESFRPAAWIMVASAVGLALAVICTKALTRTESTLTILFWMNAIQLPLNFVASDPLFPWKIETGQAWAVLGMMITGISGHFCLTNAFRWGDATVVIPVDFLRLPIIATLGWWLYQEPLDPFVFVGAGIIVSGVLWNLRSEAQRLQPASPPLL